MFPEEESSQGDTQEDLHDECFLRKVHSSKMPTRGVQTQSGELEERGGKIPRAFSAPSSCYSANIQNIYKESKF